jgi:hypothetical protein
MATSLAGVFDAIASGLQSFYPGTTGAQVRAVWDKIYAGQSVAAGFEAVAAQHIQSNRATIDALRAAEEAPNRATLEAQALAALDTNRAALAQITTWRTTGPGAGSANLTAAQSSQALRQQADNQAAMLRQQNAIIRLLLRKLDGID